MRFSGMPLLVVDDEAHVSTLVTTILSGHGFHMIEAEDGPTALAAIREWHGMIAALITDIDERYDWNQPRPLGWGSRAGTLCRGRLCGSVPLTARVILGEAPSVRGLDSCPADRGQIKVEWQLFYFEMWCVRESIEGSSSTRILPFNSTG